MKTRCLSLAPADLRRESFAALAIALALGGCAKSEFDITPDQVVKHKMTASGGLPGLGGPVDMKHLPPGAVKHEYSYKKGDRLPDGTIADSDRKVVTVEMSKESVGGGVKKGYRIVTSDETGK